MAYDEDLADRVRDIVVARTELHEKRMFGGLAWMVRDNMAVAALSGGGVMVRVDPAEYEALLTEPGAQEMEMRGRTMRGWIRLEAALLDDHSELERWVNRGLAYAGSLPGK
ncbi:TfoX/Sxy family protein [Glycomyces xiaoerkulensis]|uniref:TfoX/Sxy family protein n=1 Tax=Glycomyces xiaoerkulensis TaxID=2038139 RepID=UPI000C255E70|nr:TfoX/Sxy family protein [Glycomyces xiaoerkulensis]